MNGLRPMFSPSLGNVFTYPSVVSHKLGYNHSLGGSSKYLHGLGCLAPLLGHTLGFVGYLRFTYTWAYKKKPIYIVLLLWKRRPFVETWSNCCGDVAETQVEQKGNLLRGSYHK